MAIMKAIESRARLLGLALAVPVVLAMGTSDATAQETQERQDKERTQEMQTAQGQDVLTIAEQQGELSLFVQAIKKAGLEQELRGMAQDQGFQGQQQQDPAFPEDQPQEGDQPFPEEGQEQEQETQDDWQADQAVQTGHQTYTLLAPTDEAIREYFDEDELNRLLGTDEMREDTGIQQDQQDPYGEPQDDPYGEQQEEDDPYGDQQGETQRPVGQTTQQATQEDREKLLRLVRAHIVIGEWDSNRLRNVSAVHNVLGTDLAVEAGDEGREDTFAQEREERQDDPQQEDVADFERAGVDVDVGLHIEGAHVVRADIQADNGVIHIIDTVLEPEEEMDQRPMQDETTPTWEEDQPTEDDDPFPADDDPALR